MGITLHAIVERLVPADDYCKTDRWVEVGKWDDFGKHFALKEWLYENAEKGWPKDSHADEDEANEGLDTWRGWTTVEETASALASIRERDASGRPLRAWWYDACATCRDTQTVFVRIEGARVDQPRPCPDCSGALRKDGIRPRPLEVRDVR